MEGATTEDRKRCARKGIVVMDLYSRIMQDLIQRKGGDAASLREKSQGKLFPYQQPLVEKDISTWDVSLCWAVKNAAKINLSRTERLNAFQIVEDRNQMMHGTYFGLDGEEEKFFHEGAEHVAGYFQKRLDPQRSYVVELDDIKNMDLSGNKIDEILQKVESEEAMTMVFDSRDKMYKIYVGKHFLKTIAKADEDVGLVFVLPSQQQENSKLIEWLTNIGKKFVKGIYKIITRRATTGSIVVYVTVSVSESTHKEKDMFDVVTSYVKEAFDSNRVIPKRAIDIMLFFDETLCN